MVSVKSVLIVLYFDFDMHANSLLKMRFFLIVDPTLKWKTLESNEKKSVQQIQKLDCFGGFSTPVFRFRSKLEGPCIGEFFGRYIIDLDERRKWDAQIENVHELHNVKDLETVNERMGGGRYGHCSRLGIGYGQTKPSIITAREQMFMYGLQQFKDGSSLIWGKEMSDEYNHLLPPGERHTRSKSHLFSATLKPSHDNSFDVEYVLQLDIGGSIPNFLTTPVLIDTVKNLFETAKQEFAGATDSLQLFLQEKIQEESHINWQSLLIPM